MARKVVHPRPGDVICEWRPEVERQLDPRNSAFFFAIACLGVLAAVPMLLAGFPNAIVGFVIIASCVGYAIFRWRSEMTAIKRAEASAELQDKTYFGVVAVTYTFLRIEYGSDVGSLNIDDHYVHFRGRRSEFSVSNANCKMACLPTAGDFGLTFAPGFSANLRPLKHIDVRVVTISASIVPQVRRVLRTPVVDSKVALLPPMTGMNRYNFLLCSTLATSVFVGGATYLVLEQFMAYQMQFNFAIPIGIAVAIIACLNFGFYRASRRWKTATKNDEP